MDGRTRVGRIYKAGLEGIEDGLHINIEDLPLLQALAAMIDYATKKPVRRKASDEPKLLYSEFDVLKSLTGVQIAVVKPGRLSKVLTGLSLKDDDLMQLRNWWQQSMLPWLQSKDIEVTYSMVCRKFPDWLGRARQWVNKPTTGTNLEQWR